MSGKQKNDNLREKKGAMLLHKQKHMKKTLPNKP